MRVPVVRVEQVVKDFRPGFGLRRRRVLHGISFCVYEGEIFGFVGPNGAGKTTTLKVLMGLIRPTAGRASVLGHDVSETEFRRHVGFLPEKPYFYDYLTGREIARLLRAPVRGAARRRARRAWTSCSRGSGSRRRRTSSCAPTRRACSSGSASRRRSCTTPNSCSSTSR